MRGQLADVTALEVDGLTVAGDRGETAVRGVSFSIREGEIVGVAGVAGNGQRELAEALSGMRDIDAGSVRIAGRTLRGGDPREAILAGVAHVPEDRLGTGLAPSLSVTSNVVMKTYRRRSLSHGPLLALRRMREVAVRIVGRYDVKTSRYGDPRAQPLGRQPPEAHPGPGVRGRPARPRRRAADPRARRRRDRDGALVPARRSRPRRRVLVMSEDLDELRALSDRILVVYEGEIVGELHAGAASIEEIGLLMAGGARE